MGLQAYHLYRGGDWQTYRYAVAQVYDTLDQIREATAVLLSGGADTNFAVSGMAATSMLTDLCSDLSGELDLALADLSATMQKHLPSRWLMVELRAIVSQMPALTRRIENECDLIPQLADLAERARHVLQRIDQ